MAPSAIAWPAVLDLLADGQWHSGIALGEALTVSRAAIWKQVRALRSLGLEVVAERRRGYRLERPLDLLNVARIRSELAPATRAALDTLEVLVVTASTNACLTLSAPPAPGQIRAAVAEYQTGGRGRRGRRWLSPPGHGVCMSIAWSFESAPRDLPALSLVAGVAVVEALKKLGVDDVQLKWPNDVMAAGGKVGGILVEVSGESGGPLRVVIGIGLNVLPVPGIEAALREEGSNVPAVALDDLLAGGCLDRSVLVGILINTLHASLLNFGDRGWSDVLPVWRQHDYLVDRSVVVTRGAEVLRGVARGIADDGALLVEADGRVLPIMAGDVTLRAPPSTGGP